MCREFLEMISLEVAYSKVGDLCIEEIIKFVNNVCYDPPRVNKIARG